MIYGAPAGVWSVHALLSSTQNKPTGEKSGHVKEANYAASKWSHSEENVQEFRCSPAETSDLGPVSFVCALPGCRACCALLRMANSCEMLLLLHQTLLPLFFFFLSPPPPLLLFAITTTGAPHTQSFYTAETTWGFPPTGQKIKIIQPRSLPSADTPGLLWQRHRRAEARFSSHLNAPPPPHLFRWNDLLIHTSLIFK